jgi:hypothetical protein
MAQNRTVESLNYGVHAPPVTAARLAVQAIETVHTDPLVFGVLGNPRRVEFALWQSRRSRGQRAAHNAAPLFSADKTRISMLVGAKTRELSRNWSRSSQRSRDATATRTRCLYRDRKGTTPSCGLKTGSIALV